MQYFAISLSNKGQPECDVILDSPPSIHGVWDTKAVS